MPWKECNAMDERLRFVAKCLNYTHYIAYRLTLQQRTRREGARKSHGVES